MMALQFDAPPLMNAESQFTKPEADGITLGQIFATFWRRRLVLLSVTVGIVFVGFLIVRSLTPTFTSTAVIVLSARHDKVVDLEQANQGQDADAVVRSEADALQSRTLINRVIEREKLMDDPEFNIYARPFKPNLLTRLGIVDHLPSIVQNYLRSRPLDPSLLTPERLEYNVASQVLRAYEVSSDVKTYTVKISFTSIDADKASRIANTFADEYMKSQIDEQTATADHAADWLNPRLVELGKKAEAATRAVEEFREANNIVDFPSGTGSAGAGLEGNTLALQEIQNLGQQLGVARSTRAQLEADQKEIQQLLVNPEQALSAPAVADAPVIENLRLQEVAAAAHLAEVMGTYGERHPVVLDAKNALQKLRERFNEAIRQTVKQLDVHMRQAQANETQLQTRMDQLTKVRSAENRVMPRLLQLEAEQVSATNLYQTFSQGFYRALAEDGVPVPKGRIVQRAQALDWPSFPNTRMFMTVISVAAAMTAIAIVYALEARDKSFRNASEIEQALRLPVLGLTLLAPKHARRLVRRRVRLSRQILTEPNSAMSEMVRLVRTAINFSGDHPPKVVMVTSALPGEGKTTLALMLARQAAASGKRVLLIEAEMRKPTFGDDLGVLPAKGLAEYLLGRATLEEALGVDQESGAHFIAVRERPRFPAELLGSAQMTALLHQVAPRYDLILLDTPPVTITADPLQLGALIDAAVLVVKWGSSPRHLVQDGLRKLRLAGVPVAGIVMSQVDPARYRSYGYGELPYGYAKGYYAVADRRP